MGSCSSQTLNVTQQQGKEKTNSMFWNRKKFNKSNTSNDIKEIKKNKTQYKQSNIAPCPERGEQLRQIPLQNGLSDDERDRLGGMMVERRYRDGQIVFDQNEEPDGFYVILRGGARVEMICNTQNETDSVFNSEIEEKQDKDSEYVQVCAKLQHGDYFGETALINNKLRSARVVSDFSCASQEDREQQSSPTIFDNCCNTLNTSQQRCAASESGIPNTISNKSTSDFNSTIRSTVITNNTSTVEQVEKTLRNHDLITLFLCRDLFCSFFQSNMDNRSNPIYFVRRRHGFISDSHDEINNYDKLNRVTNEFTRLHYIFETSQEDIEQTDDKRQQLVKALNKNPYLCKLDIQQKNMLVNLMKRVYLDPKEKYIIYQNEVGSLLYVLLSSPYPLQVVCDNKPVGFIDENSVFGELAIVYNQKRSASVLAPANLQDRQKMELWAVDRFTYQRVSRHIALSTRKKIADFLKNVPLLASLTEAERTKVAEGVHEIHYPAQSVVARQGDHGNCMYILVCGLCKAYRIESLDEKKSTFETPYGEPVAEYKNPGDCFGEIALVSKDERRQATVVSEEYSVLLCVSRVVFDLLLEEPLEELVGSIVQLYNIPEQSLRRRPNILDNQSINTNIVTQDDTQTYIKPEWDNLRVYNILGKGSFGTVRLVLDINQNTYYALKTLKKHKILKNSQRRQVINEITIMRDLRHPFILPLVNLYRSSTHIHLLLPLAHKGDLFSLLRQHQVFTEQQARFYAASVTMAFAYMHSKGVVYRDLKPENIQVWEDGYIKLADQGFAKKIGNSGRTWTVCGTPEYLSPEILSGRGHTLSTDWWTLGIFIYEMLSSHPPFTDRTQIGIFKSILHGKIRFPSHISLQARSIISKLLSPSSSLRLGAGPHGSSHVMSHEWFNEDLFTVLKKQPSRGSILKLPCTKYFEALRLHDIPAPIVGDTQRSLMIQKSMQQRNIEAYIHTPPSSCVCNLITERIITTCPKCGCTTNVHLLQEGVVDTSWDVEFGNLVQSALTV